MNAETNAATFESVEFDPFAAAEIERVIPTSEAQREVWLADKLGTEASLAFNESVSLQLRGVLDVPALCAAVNAVVARHEALRSTVGPDGAELLIDAGASVDVPVHDLRAMGAAEREALLQRAVTREVETAFDIERGPLFRAAVYRLADAEHLLLMTAHHIVCDGWSWGVITEDLGRLYAERIGAAPGPDAAVGYGDYVAWEVAEAAGPAMREHENFWLNRFAGSALPVLELPTDRARSALRSFRSRRVDHLLDAELVAGVRKLGAKAGVSAFAAMFSGFAATLHRLTGQDDIVIGVPAAGQSASGLTSLVGHCVNLLPVRVAVDARQPFAELVAGAGSSLLDAFEHQTLTYGTLLKKLPVQRDPSRLPLVSVMFNVDQAMAAGAEAFPELTVELSTNARHFENFELFVNAAPVSGGYRLECQYNTDLFDAETVARWLVAYETLLRSAVQNAQEPVGALGLLAPSERARLEALQPAATPLVGADLMHAAMVRQSAATPQRQAVRCGDAQLSYAELDQRSNRLARALRARGIGRGERVGLCVTRGVDMLVSMLGVLKAGAAYVPLDPGFPPSRLAYYAEDAQLALLLTETAVETAPTAWRSDAAQRIVVIDRDARWLQESDQPLPASDRDAVGEDTAYIIYTSGSTGKPKGVCVPHRAVANFLASMQREPGLVADDRLAAVTTLSFDIAVLELMLPLSMGAQVVIVPRETAMDGNLLRQLLVSSGATAMQATPGTWRMLLDTDWHGGARFKALVGGESFPPDLAQALLDRTGELWNMYGPTETTIWSTLWRVERSPLAQRGMSIGRPIENTSVWILDENLRACPVGVPGEICIGGRGVALGYLDRPELTADRFVADAFGGASAALIYRTGDRGRWRNDGLLEHLGRLDFQVKVRGYRIELGEIEAACVEVAGITNAVVLAREDRPGDVRIVAYLTLAPSASLDEPGLRAHLQGKLPEYMQPQHLVVLDALPRLPNGKVDRKALPAPDLTRQTEAADRVLARNDLERAIVAAMESVLNLPGLGVHDNFFSLGGHSLLAARLTSRLNRDFELNLPLRTLFESPTPERLALAVKSAQSATSHKVQPIVHIADRRSAPLTPSQERIRFVEELHPGRTLYNTPSAHRLVGPMDAAKFEIALREIVARQPALKTFIAVREDGSGFEQVIDAGVQVDLPCEDLSAFPEAEREAELLQRMRAIVDSPIEIYRAPLFRAALYKLSAQEHVFLFMPHHIVWDGWSFDLLYTEMAAIYSALVLGQSSPLAPLAVTYGDYSQWFNDWLQGPAFDEQLAYWKKRFASAPMPKAPRTDFPRRAGMSGAGAAALVKVGKELTEQLRAAARRADVTVNMLTMALYSTLMASATDADSIVIGVPVRGRMLSELEPVMGFFNNLLPVQLAVSGERKVVDFLGDVKRELLEVFSYQDVPFERLAAEPEVAHRSQRVGLYQALFSFQDARERTRRWGELSQSNIPIFQNGATEDLGLWLMEVPDGMEGGFTYNADIYAAETAAAFRERYLELLARFAANPELTVAALTAADGSTAGQYLKRLAPDASPTAVASADATTSDGASSGAKAASVVATVASVAAEPSGPLSNEAVLTQVWATLLNIAVSDVHPQDNFFDLGGDSLLAMRAVEDSARKMGFRVDARRYIYESLGQLAAEEANARLSVNTSPAAPKPGLFGRVFAGLRGGKGDR